jgi:hypothetical protein
MTRKMTFGFKKTNAFGFRIDILESPTGREPSMRTLRGLANHVERQMNKMGKRAARTARKSGWSPEDTGALKTSILWEPATRTGVAGITPGVLSVNVPYGALYELSNDHPRRRYLGRAIDKEQPAFEKALRKKKIVEDILFGRARAQDFK